MPWSGSSIRRAWSGRIYTACPGWGAVLRHALVGKQFSTCMVTTHLYGMPWSGHSFTTCHGRDTVLRHALDTCCHRAQLPILTQTIKDSNPTTITSTHNHHFHPQPRNKRMVKCISHLRSFGSRPQFHFSTNRG